MTPTLDFSALFAELEARGERDRHIVVGGVDVRCVRVEGAREGRWDSHPESAETALVWKGDFQVAFRDGVANLEPGQACVIPRGVEHCGTSREGAQVILFKTALRT